MKLPDSCVWIEALSDTATGRRYQAALNEPDQLLVPALVIYEVRQWALREIGMEAADRILAMQRQSRIVTLNEVTAAQAAELASLHRLAALDALILASALQNKAMLISCDAHFKGLPGVDYQAKAAHRAPRG